MAQWFIAALLASEGEPSGAGDEAEQLNIRRYHWLFSAPDSEAAYARLLSEGAAAILACPDGSHWQLRGVADLLETMEEPSDQAELLWLEAELSPLELRQLIPCPEILLSDAIKCQAALPTTSGWYIAELPLVQIHDTGRHGENSLVWVQSHLIKADSTHGAYNKALSVGELQSLPGHSHRCNGDIAHWEFKGISKLHPLLDAPTDGALLYFEEFRLSLGNLQRLIRPKSALAVFKLENQPENQGSRD